MLGFRSAARAGEKMAVNISREVRQVHRYRIAAKCSVWHRPPPALASAAMDQSREDGSGDESARERATQGCRASLVLLLLIVAVGLLLRVRGLNDPPTLDELWSLELSTGRGSVQLRLPVNQVIPAPAMTELADAPPWYAVWTSLGRVTHPPGYFVVLRAWRQAFGGGDVAARWLSVVTSLAVIVLLYD